MTKEQIIKGAIALIERIAKEKGLEVVDEGTGHAFDGSFWDFEDKSGIPMVTASNGEYSIKLRPFWSYPEIDVRRKTEDGEELLVLNFCDNVRDDTSKKGYRHTEDYRVREVRVDAYDYQKCLSEVLAMIDEIKGYVAGEATEG